MVHRQESRRPPARRRAARRVSGACIIILTIFLANIAGDLAILMETLARLTEADIRQVLRILTPPEQVTVRRQSQRLTRLVRVH